VLHALRGCIAASVPFLAMKFMLHYPRVKLYKESQLEWLRDDRGLPFRTYDAPTLTREKHWLNGWGGQMMRCFGVAKFSRADVCSAASFGQARVPFAINGPAEVFRRHLAVPAKLAEILGAAGVDAAHEAVIASEGGLNADSALALLLLEELLNANGTPRAANEFWNALVKAGVPRYAEIISISDDPSEAAANCFILNLMGYPDVKVLAM
jgi:hypothetical protein